MSVLMEALARQIYGGRALKTGDRFEATSEDEAADLVAVRYAKRVARPKPVEETKPAPLQETAVEEKVAEPAPEEKVLENRTMESSKTPSNKQDQNDKDRRGSGYYRDRAMRSSR